ncbi:MAG: chorismate mutase [Spirochaetes bacterium]|nr:chorismate mutase [Spirochaetota bacterium]
MVRAVRGAIQVGADTREQIWEASARLVREIMQANRLDERRLVSVVFSMTDDLLAGNPAAGVRHTGFSETPLFCVQEARVAGAMPRVIRVLLTFRARWRQRSVAVYLDGACALRPDLEGG